MMPHSKEKIFCALKRQAIVQLAESVQYVRPAYVIAEVQKQSCFHV
jgi:hypothetical protein